MPNQFRISKGNNPLVSILIVTFNNEAVIGACIDSLVHQTYLNYEIIVTDNNSHDRTLLILQAYSSIVQVIKLHENKGFVGGNIVGLAHASGEYIVLLNPDTECETSWLEKLVSNIVQHADVGICASKMIVHGTSLIDSAGDGCTILGRGFKRGEGQPSTLYDHTEYVFGACGGAMMIRRTLIDQIGFLDNDFFLIYEDADYSFRAQLAGWRCLFVADAVVYHKVRSSIGNLSKMAVYYSIRNARFVWFKNMPTNLIIRYLPYHILQEIAVFFYFAIKHRMPKEYFKASVDFFKAIPKLLSKRRYVQETRRIQNKYLEQILTSLWNLTFFQQKIRKMLGRTT